jgi:hypothetical protein
MPGDRTPKGVELRRRRRRPAPKALPSPSAGSQPEGCRAPSSPKATGAEGAARAKRGDGARTRSWSSTSSRAAVTPAPPSVVPPGGLAPPPSGFAPPRPVSGTVAHHGKVSHPLPASFGRSGPTSGAVAFARLAGLAPAHIRLTSGRSAAELQPRVRAPAPSLHSEALGAAALRSRYARTTSAITCGVAVSKPTTSSMPASSGSAMVKPVEVMPTTINFAGMPVAWR